MVAEFNKSFLIKSPREIYIYNFFDNVDINKDETDHILQEFLQSLISSGLPPSRLNLKFGAPIILF